MQNEASAQAMSAETGGCSPTRTPRAPGTHFLTGSGGKDRHSKKAPVCPALGSECFKVDALLRNIPPGGEKVEKTKPKVESVPKEKGSVSPTSLQALTSQPALTLGEI